MIYVDNKSTGRRLLWARAKLFGEGLHLSPGTSQNSSADLCGKAGGRARWLVGSVEGSWRPEDSNHHFVPEDPGQSQGRGRRRGSDSSCSAGFLSTPGSAVLLLQLPVTVPIWTPHQPSLP